MRSAVAEESDRHYTGEGAGGLGRARSETNHIVTIATLPSARLFVGRHQDGRGADKRQTGTVSRVAAG